MKKGICLLDGGSVTMQGQETDLLQNSRHFCPSIWSYTHAEIEESSPLFLIAAIVSATQGRFQQNKSLSSKTLAQQLFFEIDTSISLIANPIDKVEHVLIGLSHLAFTQYIVLLL